VRYLLRCGEGGGAFVERWISKHKKRGKHCALKDVRQKAVAPSSRKQKPASSYFGKALRFHQFDNWRVVNSIKGRNDCQFVNLQPSDSRINAWLSLMCFLFNFIGSTTQSDGFAEKKDKHYMLEFSSQFRGMRLKVKWALALISFEWRFE
jgi:hypothetical protein